MDFTDADYEFLLHCLVVAKARFAESAYTLRVGRLNEDLAEQLDRQVAQASALIDRLNDRES